MKEFFKTAGYVLFLLVSIIIVAIIFAVVFKLVVIGVNWNFIYRWGLVIAILIVADVMIYNELDDEEEYDAKDDGNE